jgi:transcriptional regulator with XRE-family HTH domain
MIKEFGHRIRTLRLQQGISLNALASRLDVSPAYLSNLENGKTETIHLSFLNKLQEELNTEIPALLGSSNIEKNQEDDEFHFRLQHVSLLLERLQKLHPSFAEYLLSMVEQGVSLFSAQQQHLPENEAPKDYH